MDIKKQILKLETKLRNERALGSLGHALIKAAKS